MKNAPGRTVKAIIVKKTGMLHGAEITHEKADSLELEIKATNHISRLIKALCMQDEFKNHQAFVQGLIRKSHARIANLATGKEKPLTQAEYVKKSIEQWGSISSKKISNDKIAEMVRGLGEFYTQNGALESTIATIKFDILQEILEARIIPHEKFGHFIKFFVKTYAGSVENINPKNQ